MSQDKIKPKHPGGRPTKFNQELANRICELVASHPYGLAKICRMYGDLPTKETINVWRWEKKEFSHQYTLAKRIQAEILAESIEDVAEEVKNECGLDEHGNPKIDAGMLGQARLVCDNRKWTAARLAPKLYGDRQQLEELTLENKAIKDELRSLQEKLNAEYKKDY